MAIQKTDAIVLRTMPFRSSSLIITFYTRSFGKITCLAKGVREERQTRAAVYELFTNLEIIYYEKTRSDLHLVTEAFILNTYQSIRTRLESITYSSYFCELVDKLSEIHDPHEPIYELLDFCFRYLSSIPGPRLARLFEVKLLNEIGWLPFLDRCFGCSRAGLEEGYFSARQGALLCEKCAPTHPDAKLLGREALSVMRYYIGHGLEESVRLGMSKQTDIGLEALMDQFFLERLNRPLKSRNFIQQIEPAFRT